MISECSFSKIEVFTPAEQKTYEKKIVAHFIHS